MKTFSEFISEAPRVVSVSQRRKQARRMAKIARSAVVQAKKKRARLKTRSTAKLAQLARKQTIQKFRDKFYPQYNDVSLQQKVKIDQMIMAKHGQKIDKIAKKALVQLKKKELDRVKQARAAKDA
tara:strand:+ start:738 stop:1112 length:375 start_codon:yes stop_codon:yes gene_type:complete